MKPPQGAWPFPWTSAAVGLAWLVLQQSLALPQLLTALLLAWGLPRLLRGFLGEPVRLRRPGRLPGFVLRVLWDIVVANLVVARLVLSPWRRAQPAWVRLPLRVQHPQAISLLAMVITMTPGTVSCVVDLAGGEILVHALDCSDPQALVDEVRQRYEEPLMALFEP